MANIVDWSSDYTSLRKELLKLRKPKLIKLCKYKKTSFNGTKNDVIKRLLDHAKPKPNMKLKPKKLKSKKLKSEKLKSKKSNNKQKKTIKCEEKTPPFNIEMRYKQDETINTEYDNQQRRIYKQRITKIYEETGQAGSEKLKKVLHNIDNKRDNIDWIHGLYVKICVKYNRNPEPKIENIYNNNNNNTNIWGTDNIFNKLQQQSFEIERLNKITNIGPTDDSKLCDEFKTQMQKLEVEKEKLQLELQNKDKEFTTYRKSRIDDDKHNRQIQADWEAKERKYQQEIKGSQSQIKLLESMISTSIFVSNCYLDMITSIKRKFEIYERNAMWKSKCMNKWTTDDILQWLISFNISDELYSKIENVIENCKCTGEDITWLTCSKDVSDAFSIEHNRQLCDQIFQQIEKFQLKNATNIEQKENEKDMLPLIDTFSINIFSQGKYMVLNEKVTGDEPIQLVKQMYKKQLGIHTNINDIHFYSKLKLLPPNKTLKNVNIVDERHLITVKFGVDGAK
eukprot:511763_1